MTTITLSYRAIGKKSTILGFFSINWKVFYLLSILLSVIMLVFYTYSVNKLTEGAFLIKNYNREMEALLEENKVLEANFSRSDFLEIVMDKTKELSFEKTSDIKYLRILDGSLAKASQNSIR